MQARAMTTASVAAPRTQLRNGSGVARLLHAAPAFKAARAPRGVARRAAPVAALKVTAVPTKPIEGQKTGTSGLRKKTQVFMGENYLANWVQSLFSALPAEELTGSTMVRLASPANILHCLSAASSSTVVSNSSKRAPPTRYAALLRRHVPPPSTLNSRVGLWWGPGAGWRRALLQQGGGTDHSQARGRQRH
jgi:hypothetical protein